MYLLQVHEAVVSGELLASELEFFVEVLACRGKVRFSIGSKRAKEEA